MAEPDRYVVDAHGGAFEGGPLDGGVFAIEAPPHHGMILLVRLDPASGKLHAYDFREVDGAQTFIYVGTNPDVT